MAKTTAPFFSLGARGQFASTMVASSWKGIPVMRRYVVPSNPKTTAQVAHRTLFTAAVALWHSTLLSTPMRTGWTLVAANAATARSGFNAFCSEVIKATKTLAAASFAVSVSPITGYCAAFQMVNANNAAPGTDPATFEIWAGSTATNMTLQGTTTIADGAITTAVLGTTAVTLYVQLRIAGSKRSGIVPILLVAQTNN